MANASVAELIGDLFHGDLPLAIEAYDGSRVGPDDAEATIVLSSPTALARVAGAPGELGVARAYVAGDIELEGDVFTALSLARHMSVDFRDSSTVRQVAHLARHVGLHRPPHPPPEEARLHGRRHTAERDAAAIAHHYDVSNRFYEWVLGPSMTYSCAVWADEIVGLEAAQAAKHELICRKLDLQPGQRLLDVGCGWGSLAMHAAERHGVRATGVTISRRQAEYAGKRIAEAGLTGAAEVRLQDYREVSDGPFDAVSSVGMFEHVGVSQLNTYFQGLFAQLKPGGRVLNHGISRPPGTRTHLRRRGFMDRYVFPDGELHEVGAVVSAMQRAGFEVRHVENLREHYALTLRAWSANLDRHWDAATHEVGLGRAKVWRLYMAAAALNFESGANQIHQILAVKPDRGRSGMPLRPVFETTEVAG